MALPGRRSVAASRMTRLFSRMGRYKTETNHAGGLLGSITTGMPLVLRLAMKPTPSIAREQRSVDLQTMRPVFPCIGGRRPRIAVRAVPVAEAVTALVLLDLLLEADEGDEWV